MSYDNDPAVTTALELLDGAVCECGHLADAHSFSEEGSPCASEREPICDCREFRSVDFHVTRASEKEPG